MGDRLSGAGIGLGIMHNRLHERQAYYTYKRQAAIAAAAEIAIYVFSKTNEFHLRALAKSSSRLDLIVQKAASITDVVGSGAKRTVRLFYGAHEVEDDIVTEFYDAVTGGTPAFADIFVDPTLGTAPGVDSIASEGGDIIEIPMEENNIYKISVKNTDTTAQELYLLVYGYPVPRDPGLEQYYHEEGVL